MLIIPVIDLQNGQCVRLSRGDFNAATIYPEDPVELAKRFEQTGAQWLHIVDLDGAKSQSLQQVNVIEAIARATTIKLQVGGGVRQEEDVLRLINAGADRVLVGSMAILNPPEVGNWITHQGREKIVVAMDVRLSSAGIPEVLTRGWLEGSRLSLWDVLTAYKGSGLKTILCTDIQRDGMLSGGNHELYSKIRQIWSDLNVIASGGVNSMDDLRMLGELGLYGAIVGRAAYDGHMDLAEAVRTFET